ncbi:MAG: TonB-dependent receptor [Acidobacteria bacterium]|nr:TonB-dependent receptor [Acidobacteriota bacterium]
MSCICLGILLLFLTAKSEWAYAQNVTGSIVGTLTDTSGAVLSGAAITVTNSQTQFTRTVTTGTNGDYVVTPLAPGEYIVRASATGFRTREHEKINLEVNQSIRVDFHLDVGSISETVKVTGGVPIVESQSSTIGTVIENKQVVEMPLNGREYTQLILLTPGAVPAQTGQLGSFSVGGIAPSVNGQRSQSNNYTLDGIENNETYFNGFAMAPSVDAINEFKIQSNITSAEFGRAAGVNVNVATKNGTNSFHGSAYDFLRNDVLDALPYASGLAGLQKAPFRQNDFGGTIGGPIRKNRTFFFFSYEGFRNSQDNTILSTVPTEAMRNGDLSGGPAIFDPASTRPDSGNPGQFIRDEFSGGIIPSDRINPAAALWMNLFLPLPNLPGDGANYANTQPLTTNNNQYIARVDHRLSESDSIYVRYAQSKLNNTTPGELPLIPTETGITTRNIAFTIDHVFNSSTVAEFRAGYNYTRHPYGNPAPPLAGPDFVQQTGISSLPPNPTLVPFVPTAGVDGLFYIQQFAFQVGPNHTYQYIASLTHTAGRHTLKAGFENRNYRNYSADSVYTQGAYNFSDTPTANPEVTGTGSPFASFLLGYPVSFQRIAPNPVGGRSNDAVHPGTSSWNGYVQDDWRVTPKLTLNLGLRYEYNAPAVPRDKPNQLANVDFPSGQVLWASTNPLTGAAANVRPSIVDPDRNNFAPRLGFAYSIDPKTVIRGGGGIFYYSTFFQHIGDLADNPPFVLSQAIFPNTDPATQAVDLQHITFTSTSEGLPDLLSCYCVNRHNRTSYSSQWNLGIQRSFGSNLLAEVNYVGNKANKLEINFDRNQPLPGPGNIDDRRPIQGYTVMDWKENSGWSSYHSLQAKLEKRFSSGLSVLTFYTWSHTMDLASGLYSGSLIDVYDPNKNRGLSDIDMRHNFVFSYIYELPIGPGKRFLVSGNPVLRKLSEGWQIAGITSLHSGTPISVDLGLDNANVGGSARPDQISNPNLSHSQRTPQRWFDTSAFAMPGAYSFGNAGRNTIIAPGAQNWDMSISKRTSITERAMLEFRTEFFNMFNHVQFTPPDTNFSSPTFGQILDARAQRQLQFGMKLLF